jgi:hypothetical protein
MDSPPALEFPIRTERTGRLMARNSSENRDLLRRKSDHAVELLRYRIRLKQASGLVWE